MLASHAWKKITFKKITFYFKSITRNTGYFALSQVKLSLEGWRYYVESDYNLLRGSNRTQHGDGKTGGQFILLELDSDSRTAGGLILKPLTTRSCQGENSVMVNN